MGCCVPGASARLARSSVFGLKLKGQITVADAIARLQPETLYRLSDLRKLGIPFTRQHIYRLQKQGEFPIPIKLGPGRFARNFWLGSEVMKFLAARAEARFEHTESCTLISTGNCDCGAWEK